MRTVFKRTVLPLLLGMAVLASPGKSQACNSFVTLSPALGSLSVELLGHEVARSRLKAVSAYSPLPGAWKRPEVATAGRIDQERLIALQPECVFHAPGVLPKDAVDRLSALLARSKSNVKLIAIPMDSLAEIASAYRLMGAALGVPARGEELAASFVSRLKSLKGRLPPHRVVVQLDEHPLIVLGGGRSFLSEALSHLGVRNVFATLGEAYPRISVESVVARKPERIWILGEPENAERYERMAAEWRRRFPSLAVVRDGSIRVILSRELTLPTRALLDGLERIVRDESQ